MHVSRVVTLLVPVLVAQAVANPATATTLVRHGLDRLAVENEMIVHARVLDIRSYWNADHTFILTDVHAQPLLVLKGAHRGEDVTFTVMGGTVGTTTMMIVGGADVAPGSEYMFFLAHVDLPGAPNRLTIRDLSQGVFDFERGRVSSQAVSEPLLPDADGRTDVPGGKDGMTLDDMIRQIHATIDR